MNRNQHAFNLSSIADRPAPASRPCAPMVDLMRIWRDYRLGRSARGDLPSGNTEPRSAASLPGFFVVWRPAER